MPNDIFANGEIAPQHDQFSRLPAEMKARPQWGLAGASKAPLSVDANGKLYNASVKRPDQWLTFERAVELVEQHRNLETTHTGSAGIAFSQIGLNIGFMFTPATLLSCIDIDVVNETTQRAKGQEIDPSKWTTLEEIERYVSIARTFDSYAEVSRSGWGLHILVRGYAGKGWRRDGVEVYSQDRFLICTGDVWLDRPLADGQALLDRMVTRMKPLVPEQDIWGEPYPDYALADRASRNDRELGKLFRGDWEGRYRSHSDADLALVKLLLPHVDFPRECWETFRLSKLGQRSKAARPDYARSTMNVAMQHLAKDAEQVQHGRELAEAMGLTQKQAPQEGQFWPITGHNSARFQLLSDDDFERFPPLRWLVKGIIPDAGIGAIFGDSGTFKSFLTLDLLAHVSNGQEWFGKKVKAKPVVYIPFEGQGGVPNRIKAWRLAEAMRREPDVMFMAAPPTTVRSFVAVIIEPMNLRDPADREKFVATLIERGWAGGILCIDTLAHASNGIDENSSQMGEMIGIFRDLQHRLGGVILLIHHSGKDQTRGMRGWSGLHAAMDFVIECQRVEGNAQAKFVLSKVKDGSDGLSFKFDTSSLVVGYDEDGDEITSLTVHPAPDDDAAAEASTSQKQTKKGLAAVGAETLAVDDQFVEGWIRNQVLAGSFPSKNSLKAQLAFMKKAYAITQDRVLAAIDRLQSEGRIMAEPKSPNGNPWLRPIDQTLPAGQVAVTP